MSESDDWNLGFLAALEALPGSAARRLSSIGLAVETKSTAWCQGFNYGQALVALRLSRSQAKKVPEPIQAQHPAVMAASAHHYAALQGCTGSSRLH
jgi:hypothetical protein